MTTATPTRIKLLYKPHPGQAAFHKSKARYRILACGRRWGKTRAAAAEALRLTLSKPKQRGWIVAPTYSQTQESWRAIEEIAPPELLRLIDIKRSDRRWVFPNGSEIEFRTAERPENLRGAGLNWAIVDEAAQVSENAWLTLRPTLSDKLGRIILITTPFGRNWVYREYVRGTSDEHPNHESWRHSSRANPHFPAEEWEAARGDVPADWFAQEYEAQFLDDAAMVFRGIEGVLSDSLDDIESVGPLTWGCDLAKARDWTVCIALDQGGILRHFERWQHMLWPDTKARIRALATAHGGRWYIDKTGVGDPIVDDLLAAGVDGTGYLFTNQSKHNLVTGLQVAIEQKTVYIPTDAITLVDELRNFGYEMLASGRVRFQAIDNKHDDCVMALALAHHGLRDQPRPHIDRADVYDPIDDDDGWKEL